MIQIFRLTQLNNIDKIIMIKKSYFQIKNVFGRKRNSSNFSKWVSKDIQKIVFIKIVPKIMNHFK